MFIASAFAQDGAIGSSSSMIGVLFNYLPIILVFAILYFMVIRPQNLNEKARKNLVASLKKGDVVLTESGIMGEVVQVESDMVKVDSGSGAIVLAKFSIKKKLDADDVRQWRKLNDNVAKKR